MAWIDTKHKPTGPRYYVCWRAGNTADPAKKKICRSRSYRDLQEVELAQKAKEAELLENAPPSKIVLEVVEPSKKKIPNYTAEVRRPTDKPRFTAFAYRKKKATAEGKIKSYGTWRAGWRDEYNIDRTKGGFLGKEAAKAYAEKQLDLVQKRVSGLAPIVTGKSVGDALDAFCSRPADRRGPICEDTHELNRRQIEPFLEFGKIVTVNMISKDGVERWWNHLKADGRNLGGQGFNLKIVRAFCNFCRRKGWLVMDPFDEIAIPRGTSKGVYLIASQRDKLLTHVDPRYKELDEFWCRATQFGLYSCLRIGQVFYVDWSHFNSETEKLKVLPWKRQKERTIKLPPKAIAAMGEQRLYGRVFDRWTTLESMRESFKKRVERLGLKGIRFHDTGHTMISRLFELGYSPAEVREYTGKSWSTIQQYSHAYKKHLEEKIVTFDYPEESNAKSKVGLL